MKSSGKVTILLTNLGRSISRPLLRDIAITPANKRILDVKFIGIIDTGADITKIDPSILKHGLNTANDGLYYLELTIPNLFNNSKIVLEVGAQNISNNNIDEDKPDILLGRDFLKHCILTYNGLTNLVEIESFEN